MAAGEWVAEVDLEDEIGKKNLYKLANLDSDGLAPTIERHKQRAVDSADQVVNALFRDAGFRIPLQPLPGKEIDIALIRLCASKIAHWFIYNTKGKRDEDKEGDHVKEKYDWAIETLERLIASGVDAITTVETEPPIIPGQMRTIRINKNRGVCQTLDEWAN